MNESEIEHFRQQGYAGPYRGWSESEMSAIRQRLDREVFVKDGPGGNPYQCRHLDTRQVWELCSHPSIVERMAAVFGPDLVLWRSHFFNKEPGAVEIPWHQDRNYWPLEPLINISAWVAIDAATRENACVQFIPGSHKVLVPHVKAEDGMAFGEMADPAHVDTSRAIDMVLRPGEFVLFNERTLHHSEPNRSQLRRLGLAVRVTVPMVKVYHEQLFASHRCVLLHGEDRAGFNRMVEPPPA